jgi:hypothetical protein
VRYTDRGILFSVGRRTAPAQWDVVLMRKLAALTLAIRGQLESLD